MTPEQYELINRYLSDFYETPLYTVQGQAHPIRFHAASVEQRRVPDSVLGRIPTETIPQTDLTIYDYGYLHSLQNSQRQVFNGRTFAMTQLRFNPLKIEAAFGNYFDVLATGYALEQELFQASIKKSFRLPLRSQYHREISPQRALVSGKGRSAAIGGGTLIIFNDAGTYKLMLQKRQSQQATRPNSLHVLPAFMFQPMDGQSIQQAWSIEGQIYREFLEELFGMEESRAGDFMNHPALVQWRKMQAEGQAALYLLGISFSLLTLRPEFIALLLIHDSDWWQSISAPNSPTPMMTSETDEDLLLIPIESDAAILAAIGTAAYLRMPPQALVTLWEGVALARSLLA